MSATLEAALSYAARGWPVIPIWEPKNNWCSCGDPACRTPAKHPRNKGGEKSATIDHAQIKRWWKGYPAASVAIVTGKPSGLWVLAVDPDDGARRLSELEELNGETPPTMEAITGSGARHLYFHHNPALALPPDALGHGLQILSDGQYVIAPPSSHMAGTPYRWRDGMGAGSKIAPIPSWIVSQEEERVRLLSIAAHQSVPVISGPSATDFNEAVSLYLQHNMMRAASWLPYPQQPSCCPVCPGRFTFKVHPVLSSQWICISPEHRDCGRRQGAFWTGDVLDIDATQRGRTRRQHMEQEGYWGAAVKVAQFQQRVEADRIVASSGALATVTRLVPLAKDRQLTNSLASCVRILSDRTLNRPVIGERRLEYNQFSNLSTIGRVELKQSDITMMRFLCEENHCDVKGNGITFGGEVMERAVELVSESHPYHPVREYLDSLVWDGTERLPFVPADFLGAPDSPINRAFFRRWMISAVARICDPGCQADSMLVLVHPEGGEGKSSFFRALGGAWFADDRIPIADERKGPHAIQGKWIIEWNELEALMRAKDDEEAKTFIVKRVDNYLPPYAKFTVTRPRQCVFCGTTNKVEFMRSRGGRRRFWPILVGDHIDIDRITAMRDALWAEAYFLYHHEEQWHLTPEEKRWIGEAQDEHMTVHPWTGLIVAWLEEHTAEEFVNGTKTTVVVPAKTEVTAEEILRDCIRMEPSRWETKFRDNIRDILRSVGWEQVRPQSKDGEARRPRLWKPVGMLD